MFAYVNKSCTFAMKNAKTCINCLLYEYKQKNPFEKNL